PERLQSPGRPDGSRLRHRPHQRGVPLQRRDRRGRTEPARGRGPLPAAPPIGAPVGPAHRQASVFPDFGPRHDAKATSLHWPVFAKGGSRMSVATRLAPPFGAATRAPPPVMVKWIVPDEEERRSRSTVRMPATLPPKRIFVP